MSHLPSAPSSEPPTGATPVARPSSAPSLRGSHDRVKVLFILSCERSGSTITGSLLSQLDGWFGGGEIRRVWHDLESEPTRCGCGEDPWRCKIWASIGPTRLDPRCGCGRPLRSCEVWPRVASEALERAGLGLTASEVVQLQRSVVRYRHTWRVLPHLLRERHRPASPEVARYAALTGQLFRSLKEVTGCRVVVDTSKEAVDAVILTMDPDIDVYLLHLVRDPRGVLYSTYRRYSPVPETGFPDRDPRAARPRQAAYVSTHWNIQNLTADALSRGRHRCPLLRVTYEDFLRRPAHWLQTIARFVDEEPKTLPRLEAASVELRPSHTVTGNRARFRTGAVEIPPDMEWEKSLHPTDTAIATALTSPLLRRYGYPIRRPRAGPA